MHIRIDQKPPEQLMVEQERLRSYISKLPTQEQAFTGVFSVSPFVTRQYEKYGDELVALVHAPSNRHLIQSQLASLLHEAVDERAFKAAVRRYRNLHMAAIAWRDLIGLADLDETLGSLSDLADCLVEAAQYWYQQSLVELHGQPVDDDDQPLRLIVLAMGKLGARELNFSSDIDLIFAYESDGQTSGKRSVSHQEFFLAVARKLHHILNDITEDGFVYRTDLRLRPYGDSGPLVMSMDAMEEYYQTQGREWERYAMIKARAIGEDIAAGDRLLKILRPFVYRRYIDYGVIQSLRELKSMIDKEALRKDRLDNLKLGPGGIREIEFIAQVFQLIRGGQDASLRVREVQIILRRLADRNYLDSEIVAQLINAYRFLRQAENHIQAMQDQQEHKLPDSDINQARLAYSMGYESYDRFKEDLQTHRDRAQDCFDRLFAEHTPDKQEDALAGIWLSDLTMGDDNRALLQQTGFIEPEQLLEKLARLKQQGVYLRLSSQGKERMDALMPALLQLSGDQQSPDLTIDRLLAVVAALAQRESYLALLNESPAARKQLARLCSHSSWITQVITQHPILLDELIDDRRLFAVADRAQLNIELSELVADVDVNDIEVVMERLRQFKQAQQLHIAAADIIDVMPLMVVSDHLTWLAEALVTVTLELAWDYMLERHGRPTYELDGAVHEAQFTVIAYGKLGGIELGYGSDLDLVFIHDSQGQKQQTQGDKPVDNTVFFTRLAQRFVHLLATRTPAGVLYEIDTRLRPNGQSGLLVTSLIAFTDYQQNEAWTWEHQALVRARPVAGGIQISQQFESMRQVVLTIVRDTEKLATDVVDMRRRMREELDQSNSELFDLKQGPGGIVDIEFMVQYLTLRWAHELPGLTEFTDVIRLLEVVGNNDKLSKQTAEALIEIYRTYRGHLHHLVLQEAGRTVPAGEYIEQRELVSQVWQHLFESK